MLSMVENTRARESRRHRARACESSSRHSASTSPSGLPPLTAPSADGENDGASEPASGADGVSCLAPQSARGRRSPVDRPDDGAKAEQLHTRASSVNVPNPLPGALGRLGSFTMVNFYLRCK